MPKPLVTLMTMAAALSAQAADNVLLVVNGDSWASTYIANEYAAARSIPASNMVVIRDLPSFEHMGVEDFRTRILRPALHTAEERGLAPQIDYLLYSADFPTAIDVTADMAGKQFPKPITQPASLTGLTFFYPLVQAKNPEYLGLNANFYFRGRAPLAPQAPLPAEERKAYAEILQVLQKAGAAHAQDPAKVDTDGLRALLPGFLALRSAHPKNGEILYNLACVYALLGDGEQGVNALRDAVGAGWWDMGQAMRDPDLASLRDRDDFKALRGLARQVKVEVAPAGGFRGIAGWLPGGRLMPPSQGMHYLLSTMLAYTSGGGNSVKEALASLKRSVEADGSRPAGTIYFMKNGDVRSTTREWGFAVTAEKLREAGVAAEVADGVLPQGKADVAGATIGAATFDWPKSGSSILPGAICEHLTSWGGALGEGESGGQTTLAEFIRHGAAGASGTVMEPYAIQAKFPTPLIHWYYAQGSTLGEAFYQGVEGPYQLLIVGDALCTPWKKRLSAALPVAKEGAPWQGLATLRPTAESSEGIGVANVEIHVDGRRMGAAPLGTSIALDTTRLADGVHAVTIVANGKDPLGTRVESTRPVLMQNQKPVKVTAKAAAAECAWDQELEISAAAEGASAIVLRHWSGEVGRIAGAKGVAKIDARRLGQGPVVLQPVALLEGGREVWGEPIRLRVVAPAALVSREPGGVVEPGFTVTPAEGAPSVAMEAKGDWLAKAGVKADGAFTVDAWFNVPEQDVYQFQIRGAADVKLEVDGKMQDWPRGKEWAFIPVHLAGGTHQLRLSARAVGAPQVDLRFGGPGAQRLAGARFQHRK